MWLKALHLVSSSGLLRLILEAREIFEKHRKNYRKITRTLLLRYLNLQNISTTGIRVSRPL